MRKPSPATELRTLRSSVRHLEELRISLIQQRDHMQSRARKAEQDADAWKQRFDALLARTPEIRR